jgi:hypothetical protein
MLHKDNDRKGSLENKSLVVGLKGLDAKKNYSQLYSNFDFDKDTELVSRFSQSGNIEKYGNGSHWTQNQKRLRWRKPASIYPKPTVCVA